MAIDLMTLGKRLKKAREDSDSVRQQQAELNLRLSTLTLRGEHLEQALGWESVYAYKAETFGPNGTLGRADTRAVVLTRDLRLKECGLR